MLIVRGDNWTGWVHTDKLTDVPCVEGDFVRVFGEIVPSLYQNDDKILASKIETTGHGDLPAVIEVPGCRIADGSLEFQFVRARGVIVSVSLGNKDWNWVVVRSPSGDFGVSIKNEQHSLRELKELIDAEVSVRGIVVYSWGDKYHLGAHISLRDGKDLAVLMPPPKDPFAAPALDKVRPTHRQTIRGTVVATGARSVMVNTEKFGIIRAIPSEHAAIPEVGRLVAAAGFAKTDPVHILLTETLFRDDGIPSEPVAKASTKSLAQPHDQHGYVIDLFGTVLGVATLPGGVNILSLDHKGSTFAVDITTVGKNIKNMPPIGATVHIAGICVVEYENASVADAFPRFRSMTVLPRTPDDIVVLQNPPWWTPARLLTTICVVLAVLAGAFAWVIVLHRLAERRGRELFRECQAHEAERQSREIAEIRMRDRTRLAVELHDTISQTLTGATMQLGSAAQFAFSDPAQALRHIEIASHTIDSCREELRNCIWDLRNNALDESDVNKAIRQTIQHHVGGAKLHIRFNIARERLSDNTVHAIMRIVRELAANAVRHGAAKTLRIAGAMEDGKLMFSVADDGCGFDPMNRPGLAEGHFGLQGIEERVEELGGKMSISSAPGKGTRVSIWIKAS